MSQKARQMKRLVIFSGAGISAESGIRTFRGSDGLWENHAIEDVATPQAWQRDPDRVLRFYNERRKQVIDAQPNKAHYACAELQKSFDTNVITQNIDDLHERAGSRQVLHLHGEIRKARSSLRDDLILDIEGTEIKRGEFCPQGSQLRPHVVWFGEAVPMMEAAFEISTSADIFVVVGTSLNVYPAAGLLFHTRPECEAFLIDPDPNISVPDHVTYINEKASTGLPKLASILLERPN